MYKFQCYMMLLGTLLLSAVLIVHSGTITKVQNTTPETVIEEESSQQDINESLNNDENKETEDSTDDTEENPVVDENTTDEQSQNTQTVPVETKQQVTIETVQPCDYSMSDCLLIGDSRLDDMRAFGNIQDADFFSGTGLSLFHYQETTASINGLGNVTFDTLIHSKTYNKIYIMIGLNDLGRNFDMTIDKYTELINTLKTVQPDAKIIICANLHVTKEYSATSESENNENVNKINQTIYNNYVDYSTVFYIDSNEIFDDSEGYLRSDLTNDGVHPMAKYYANWSEWIKSESRRIFADH